MNMLPDVASMSYPVTIGGLGNTDELLSRVTTGSDKRITQANYPMGIMPTKRVGLLELLPRNDSFHFQEGVAALVKDRFL